MTIIFRDGRLFVPTTIFVPQFKDYHFDSSEDVQISQKTPIIKTHQTDCLSQTICDDIRDIAALTFQKLYRNQIDDFTFHDDACSDIFRMTFNQLAEKRLRNDAENNYNNFIASREEKIRLEQKRLLEIEDYNREFDEKLSQAKQREADKKKQSEERKTFLKGLLLGDKDDPSIPKPALSALGLMQAAFFKIRTFKTYYINAVDKIYPVTFGSSNTHYRPIRDISINCKIKPRKQIIFLEKYRTWCEQFVRKIIEKRQRGPPLMAII